MLYQHDNTLVMPLGQTNVGTVVSQNITDVYLFNADETTDDAEPMKASDQRREPRPSAIGQTQGTE